MVILENQKSYCKVARYFSAKFVRSLKEHTKNTGNKLERSLVPFHIRSQMTQMHWCYLKCVCASLGRHPHPIIFEFGKYGENDNFARIANRAKHKAMRGPIKVGDTGEFGKYDEKQHAKTLFLNKSEFKNEISEAYKDETEQCKILVSKIT